MRWLTGWTAVILLVILAVIGTVVKNQWVERLSWTAAALVAVHAAWQAWAG